MPWLLRFKEEEVGAKGLRNFWTEGPKIVQMLTIGRLREYIIAHEKSG